MWSTDQEVRGTGIRLSRSVPIANRLSTVKNHIEQACLVFVTCQLLKYCEDPYSGGTETSCICFRLIISLIIDSKDVLVLTT